jgi:DNA-binding phage protein
LDSAVARFYRTSPDWLAEIDCASPPFVARFLRDQQGDASIIALARRAGVNRFTVARWLSGTSEPRLPDFLCMVEAVSLRLVDLISCLVDPSELPSVAETWRRHEAERSLAIDTPWAMAVLRALEVRAYEGQGPVVGARLQLDPTEVARCLGALERAGLIEQRCGSWHPRVMETLDTRRSPETARRLKSFWGRVGLDRLEAGTDGGFAYNLMSISHDQLRRLRELHDAYFQAVRAIVAEDVSPECVALLHLQLVRLDGSAPEATCPAPIRERSES